MYGPHSYSPAPTITEENVDPLRTYSPITWEILVINEEVNSFENMINAFCQTLKYTTEAAEAKAWEIHLNGKAVVCPPT